MLAIRLQRTGRSGHAMFRIIVQDSRKSASSGKIVAYLGNYDPHSKKIDLDKEKASHFLSNGAQPSDRIARIFKSEGVKLPSWVNISSSKKRAVKNTEKRRSTATEKEEVAETSEEAPAETESVEVEEAPAEEAEKPVEVPAEDPESSKDS